MLFHLHSCLFIVYFSSLIASRMAMQEIGFNLVFQCFFPTLRFDWVGGSDSTPCSLLLVDPYLSIEQLCQKPNLLKEGIHILLAMQVTQFSALSDICVSVPATSIAEEIHQRNDPLLSMLKDVYVESKDPVPQV